MFEAFSNLQFCHSIPSSYQRFSPFLCSHSSIPVLALTSNLSHWLVPQNDKGLPNTVHSKITLLNGSLALWILPWIFLLPLLLFFFFFPHCMAWETLFPDQGLNHGTVPLQGKIQHLPLTARKFHSICSSLMVLNMWFPCNLSKF